MHTEMPLRRPFGFQAGALLDRRSQSRQWIVFSVDPGRASHCQLVRDLAAWSAHQERSVLILDAMPNASWCFAMGWHAMPDLCREQPALLRAPVADHCGAKPVWVARVSPSASRLNPEALEHSVQAAQATGCPLDLVMLLAEPERAAPLARALDAAVLVPGPGDAVGLTAAYRTIKRLQKADAACRQAVVYHQVNDPLAGAGLHDRLAQVARRFLGIDLQLQGLLPSSEIRRAQGQGKPTAALLGWMELVLAAAGRGRTL
jgi:hypothetical protein